MPGDLLPEAVLPRLRGRFGRHYRYVPSCASTQRLLPPDAPEGAVAVADFQTAGRGSRGRRWLAEPGTSVLCSIALSPAVETARLPELSLVAGRAVVEAVAAVTGLDPELKHPNDVVIRGRKLAGLLAEAGEGRVVLGIGINVNARADQLPSPTDTPATSLLVETGTEVERGELLAAVLERLERRYDEWLGAVRRPH